MASYNDALQSLSTEKWNQLSVQEKLDVLQAVENEVASRDGRSPCKVQGQYIQSDGRGITLGYYSRTDRTITINTEQLEPSSKYGNDYKVHLDTVLHEGRHAYQHQAIIGEVKHDNKEELVAWTDNMQPGHYITYEKNPRGYFSQPIERDARGYAQNTMTVVEKDKTLLREKTQQAGNQTKVLKRNPDELRRAVEKNIEDILDMRRDDLRDKGMKDGPEMEQIIQRERQELQAQFEHDAFGNKNTDYQEPQPSLNSKDYTDAKSSDSKSNESSQDGKSSDMDTSKTSTESKKAMFTGTNSSHNQKSSTRGSENKKGNTVNR